MSALPTSLIRALPSHHDAKNFCDVATAAKLLGITERAVQLQCRGNKLMYLSVPNPNGGKPIFLIDRRSNTQLAPGASAKKVQDEAFARIGSEQRTKAFAFKQLSDDAAQYIADARQNDSKTPEKTILETYLNYRRVSDKSVPSLRSFYRKSRALRESHGSLVALADRRKVAGLGGSCAVFTDEAWRWFWTVWADSKLSAHTVYDMLLAEIKDNDRPWQVPSEDTVLRRLKQVPEADRVEQRQGKDAREDGYDPYMIRQYGQDFAADDQWQSDHHQLDITAIDDLPGGDGQPARLWLTTWLDVRSRFVVAWRLSRGPNSIVVMASFCDAVLAHGIPRGIYIDNGKDYRSKRFAGGRAPKDPLDDPGPAQTHVRSICEQLGVVPRFALPYGARSKLIEPWHGHWICNEFSKAFPSYTGNNPQNKPEGLNDLLHDLDAKSAKTAAAALAKVGRWSEILPLLEKLIMAYNMSPHQGHGMEGNSPQNIYTLQSIHDKRTACASTLHLLLQECHKLKVGRNGVLVGGYTYGGDLPELMRLQGDYVLVRLDSIRADVVYIYDLQDCYLCDAFNFGLCDANATQDELKAAKIVINRAIKMRKALAPIEKLADAPGPQRIIELQLLVAQNKAKQLPSPVAPPRNILPIEYAAPAAALPRPQLRLTSAEDHEPSSITSVDLDQAAASHPQSNSHRRKEPPATPPARDQGSDPWSVFDT